METVSVIGAGSWGTAVARHLVMNGHVVRLWSHNAEAARLINERRENPRYLPGCMGARNRYLVDHSDLLFAVFSGIRGGTSGTIDYAASRGRDILLLRPDNFRVLRLTKET